MGRDRGAEFRFAVISLRLARASDAPELAAIYAPFVEHTWVSFEERIPDATEMAARIEASRAKLPWLVADADGTVAGYAYASDHRARAGYRWSVDVSAYLDERFRRTGIATRLYGAIFAILETQKYVNVYAGIALPNDASVGFHRSAGFTDVGVYHHVGYKAGAWHDVLWLERALAPCAPEPSEPLRLESIAAREIAAILSR